MLDDETVIEAICNILDIDYEEIKDKLPEREGSTQDAVGLLDAVVHDEEDGADV